jgi:acyl-CoA reductase-like NAD-dependent aldehyde dehydrogenase
MIHIPILRKGREYESLDQAEVLHHRSRKPFARISQANVGLIRRDLLDQAAMKEALTALSVEELLSICSRAADLFAQGDLPLGDSSQTPQDYVEQTSATTGLPHVMVGRNMEKIRNVLANMRTIIRGLTRNLDLNILDNGTGVDAGTAVSYFPRGRSLGVVLPSNSPGVHSLWIPAVALKTPLILKPGGSEPWTPFRIVQALIQAGCPREAFGYYPADHAGGAEILRQCGRGIIFGDVGSTGRWRNDPRIEVHGPGYSKVIIGDDLIDQWEQYLDVMVSSILENGGRSCVNASAVWVPSRGDEIAGALAERLTRAVPLAADDDRAQLAPFVDPEVARRISAIIDQGMSQAGATEVTASHREGGRLVDWNGSSYLLPTIIRCAADHDLANREFLFPFASVIEAPTSELPDSLGPSLVVTAITRDEKLIQRLIGCPHIDRLNIGPIPTYQVKWDQPHEGNLFDHLYSRRAFQSSFEAA